MPVKPAPYRRERSAPTPTCPRGARLSAPPFAAVSAAVQAPQGAAAVEPSRTGARAGPAGVPGILLRHRRRRGSHSQGGGDPARDVGKPAVGSAEGRDRQLAGLRQVPEVRQRGAAARPGRGGWQRERRRSLSYRQVRTAAVPMWHGSDDPRSPAPPAASALPALRTRLVTDRHTQEPFPHQLRPRLHRHSRRCQGGRCLRRCGGTRSYRPPILTGADRGTRRPHERAQPRGRTGRSAQEDTATSSLTVSNTFLDSQIRSLGPQLDRKPDRNPYTAVGRPEAAPAAAVAATAPWPVLLRLPIHWRVASAPRVSFRRREWGREPPGGSAEPPQTESSARRGGSGCGASPAPEAAAAPRPKKEDGRRERECSPSATPSKSVCGPLSIRCSSEAGVRRKWSVLVLLWITK